MFQTKAAEKIKTHVLFSITFFQKLFRLWHNVEEYGRAREATDDNVIRRMRFTSWITKVLHTHIHFKYVILNADPRQECYVYTALSTSLNKVGQNKLHISKNVLNIRHFAKYNNQYPVFPKTKNL